VVGFPARQCFASLFFFLESKEREEAEEEADDEEKEEEEAVEEGKEEEEEVGHRSEEAEKAGHAPDEEKTIGRRRALIPGLADRVELVAVSSHIHHLFSASRLRAYC